MLHNRAFRDLLFHRDRRHVLAACRDDDVFGAPGERDVPFVVYRCQVAGAQPAVFGEHLGGFLGQVMVAHEHVLPAHFELAAWRDAH